MTQLSDPSDLTATVAEAIVGAGPSVGPDAAAAFGYVDPELAPTLALLPPNPYGVNGFDAVQMREQLALIPLPALATVDGVEFRDVERSADGSVPAMRIITPVEPRTDRPCIFWIHGGGYIIGSAFDPDHRLLRWAVEHDCVVVAVEYRLAPEHPYPSGLEDCYDGLLWTARNAAELDIDPAKIAVVGESAGGGLAAALVILARDRQQVRPLFQQLIYPMLDDRTAHASDGHDAPVWTKAANAAGWSDYLGPIGADPAAVPVAAAPGRAQVADLHDLPACFITVGSLDLFREEDMRYAVSLQNAGVPTELHVYAGAFHGSDHLVPDADISRRFERDLDTALGRAFTPTQPG